MAAGNGQKQMDFTPVEYDGQNIPPDAPAGEWTAVCGVKKLKTQNGNFPMLGLEWKLEDTDDDELKTHLGSSVTDFVVLFPKGHKAYRPSVMRLRKLCEALEVPLDVIPAGHISSWEDLDELIQALDKQRATIFTTVTTDSESNETRTKVFYTRPGGSFVSTEDEEEEAPKKSATKGKPPAKPSKTARR